MKRSVLQLFAAISLLAGPAQAQPAQPAAGHVLVQNKYYPKPGNEDAVLATRLEASAVRAKLGLSVGLVLLRKSDADGAPLVIWECEYPSIEAREADADKAEASPEFAAVQKKMSGLLARFQRDVWVTRPN